jgi:malate synthase
MTDPADGNIQPAQILKDFVDHEALPGTGIAPAAFWAGLARIVADFAPRNAALLARRDALQAEIDAWHAAHRGRPVEQDGYTAFLREIGYLLPAPPHVGVSTENVDAEIARIAGPQLVVPVNNARYALNAGNARWGSLYDALYGTDAIADDDGAARGRGFNPVRGARVVARAKAFLDTAIPLRAGCHADATGYTIADGQLRVATAAGGTTLAEPAQLVGWQGEAASPTAIVLAHHGLHLELRIDRTNPIGRTDPAGLADVVLESAVTTIMDCEDSVAAVDAADKVEVYRNWLGLMNGTLTAAFEKDGRTLHRRLNPAPPGPSPCPDAA